jgi:2-amino-4-hydroxy-6-hydroxymethyldihydropteridine diphosphokinase
VSIAESQDSKNQEPGLFDCPEVLALGSCNHGSKVFLSLGSNSGDSLSTLCRAATDIEKSIGKIKAKSSIYESEPWGFKAEQNFLNEVLEIETSLTPEELLHRIHAIEAAHGRIRTDSREYSSRTLDVDIIFYGDLVLESPTLVIPHPLMHQRLFVLRPLAEIAPDLIHPILKRSIKELLETYVCV